jgi:Mrp family chromosome partitioning ATPase
MRVHEALVEQCVKPELVGHISRDSTAIEGREKPIKKPKEEKPAAIKDVIPVTMPIADILTAIDRFYGDLEYLEYNDAEVSRLEDIRSTHKTFAVIASKGGVGRTHVSINLSCALSKLGKHSLLIDGDLANADVSNKLGIFPSRTLQHFFSHAKKIEERT